MRKILLALLCWSVSMLTVSAQSVKLQPEYKGVRGGWIVVAPVIDGGAPKWKVDPGLQEVDLGNLLPADLAAKLKGKIFTSAVDGRFKVEVWCAKGDVPSEVATTYLVFGTPTPVTPVEPKPQPKPGIKVGKVYVLAFDDAGKRLTPGGANQSQVNLLTDTQYWKSLTDKGHKHRNYDVNNLPAPEWKQYIDKAGGPPCIVIQDLATKKVVDQFPLPMNTKAMDERLRAVLDSTVLPNDVPVTPRIGLEEKIRWWIERYPQYADKP